MADRSVTHATFTIERTYPVPPARVFQALADPDMTTRWFAPPQEWGLRATGDGTRLIYTEQGAYLDGHDSPTGREHGTRELLDSLGRVERTARTR